MAYIRETFKSVDGKLMIVKKHHNLFAMPTKVKVRQKRMPKVNETEDKQVKINERHRKEKNMRLIADNFKAGDYYMTFTTDKKMTADEFKENFRMFMKRFRREYEKRTGEKIKYFRVMENLIGSGRPHAHMLVSNFCPVELVRGIMAGLWQEGNVKVDVYGGMAQDAYNLSSYFSKQDKKEHGAKIDTSRGNLIRREPKKEVIHAETFRDEIIAPKGWRVVKPLSYNTTTETGFPYQIAVFEKIEKVNFKNERLGKVQRESKKTVQRSSKQKSGTHARKND